MAFLRTTAANVARVLESAGFKRSRDTGPMGRTTAHGFSSGFKVTTMFNFATGKSDPDVGVEVRLRGSTYARNYNGPDEKAVVDALAARFERVEADEYCVKVLGPLDSMGRRR